VLGSWRNVPGANPWIVITRFARSTPLNTPVGDGLAEGEAEAAGVAELVGEA
jgi:hypothetical protein